MADPKVGELHIQRNTLNATVFTLKVIYLIVRTYK